MNSEKWKRHSGPVAVVFAALTWGSFILEGQQLGTVLPIDSRVQTRTYEFRGDGRNCPLLFVCTVKL